MIRRNHRVGFKNKDTRASFTLYRESAIIVLTVKFPPERRCIARGKSTLVGPLKTILSPENNYSTESNPRLLAVLIISSGEPALGVLYYKALGGLFF